jgi:predicted DNA-binding transcriptional regulator AlpA
MSTATLEAVPAARPLIPNRLLAVADVAALAHVSTSAIRYWMRSGYLPGPIRLGRVLRWDPDVIRQWLASRTVRQPGQSTEPVAEVNLPRMRTRAAKARAALAARRKAATAGR